MAKFNYDVAQAQALIESLKALQTQLSTAIEPAKAALRPFTQIGVVFEEENSLMNECVECAKHIDALDEKLQVKISELEALTTEIADTFKASMTINIRSTADAMAQLRKTVAAIGEGN